ncbi:hypothetical protein ACFQZZ_31125 [Nocardia sp. GCM10030253]|uniref:hypothetical protein n=1 Tax=Nocardia sp. GCM10030253 TaxID=3273404 RepID=UPI00363D1DC3
MQFVGQCQERFYLIYMIEFLGYLFTTVLDGRNSYLGDGVQRGLGRPPRDFADYVKAAVSDGVWES